jgi:hypothetical protein
MLRLQKCPGFARIRDFQDGNGADSEVLVALAGQRSRGSLHPEQLPSQAGRLVFGKPWGVSNHRRQDIV